MDYINAFWVGGAICALVQILMEKTKMLPGRIMVMLVCLGSTAWGSLGSTSRLLNLQGAGQVCRCLDLEIPCLRELKEAVDEYGFLGIFLGGLKASAAGISAALIFAYLASIIFSLR